MTTLFKYIGFKTGIKKATVEEMNYGLIGSFISIFITFIVIILFLLVFDKEQIADFGVLSADIILLFCMTLNVISNYIVKKKIKKIEIEKKKLELEYIYEKN